MHALLAQEATARPGARPARASREHPGCRPVTRTLLADRPAGPPDQTGRVSYRVAAPRRVTGR